MTGFFGRKKVRFSRTSTVHRPKTPQLVPGGFSPASSAGPLTPPDPYIGLPGPTPYNYYPPAPYHGQAPVKYTSPAVGYYQGPPPAVPPSSNSPSSTRVSLHRYLEHNSNPPIKFDLIDRPSTASRSGHHISSSTLSEPATNPPMHSIAIHSPYFPSSWEFAIVASNRPYVTLYDVLDQLHTQLRLNISKGDFDRWSSSDKSRATTSYEHRYRRYHSQDEYLKEKAGGMKRIDFLMERTKFLGISKPRRGEAFILNAG